MKLSDIPPENTPTLLDSLYGRDESAGADNQFPFNGIKALVNKRVVDTSPVPSDTSVDLTASDKDEIAISGADQIESIDLEEGRVVYLTFEDALTIKHDDAAIVIPGAANLGVLAGDKITLVGLAGGIVAVETLPPAPPIGISIATTLVVDDDAWLTFAEFPVRAGTIYKFEALLDSRGASVSARWNLTSAMTGTLLQEIFDIGAPTFVFSTIGAFNVLDNLNADKVLRLTGIMQAPATEITTFQFRNDGAGTAVIAGGSSVILIPIGVYTP